MSQTFIVAGAGFRGFCDAVQLLKIPDAKIHIIDSAPFFGGIAYSRIVKDFSVDNGVHVFDSIPTSLADIVNEIMDGKTEKIDFVSQSAFNGIVTDGFSLPDLSSLEDFVKEKIVFELVQLAARGDLDENPINLDSLFQNRYGKTAGGIFSQIFEKIYGISPLSIEPHGIAQTSLGRLKFLEDAEMMVLKSNPWLENVLAARRKTVGKVDDYVSIYPNDGKAMRGWCDRAAQWLIKQGVEIHLGEKIVSIVNSNHGVSLTTNNRTIDAHKIIWANDNVNGLAAALGLNDDISKYQHGTPMVFATLITKAKYMKNFTYLQNFDPRGRTYRTAAAGIFSNQIRENGDSFFTCECPVKSDSDIWDLPANLAQELWTECKHLGVVSHDAPLLDADIIRIPVTFKLPKLGYLKKVDEFRETVLKKSKFVLLRNVVPFFRRDVYLDSLKLVEQLEQ